MSAGITIAAMPEDASLAGAEGSAADGPLVALGGAHPDDRPALRWLDRAAQPKDSHGAHVIAPAGDGLWRRAPWPAADPLFDLPEPSGELVLLTGDPERRAAIAARARDRGVSVDEVERLDASALARAAAVILGDCPGGSLPARAPAVMAAGRLLLVPALETTFGFEDGLDHLQFADPDGAVTLVEAFRRAPESFRRVTTWARAKAEPHCASVVYPRLADDLRLHGLV